MDKNLHLAWEHLSKLPIQIFNHSKHIPDGLVLLGHSQLVVVIVVFQQLNLVEVLDQTLYNNLAEDFHIQPYYEIFEGNFATVPPIFY